ncbi:MULTISPECIES: hypothetical protein [Silvimonas]|uniref:hypothetical protein n=1 Tax=Silvimonas TaxID=300264 RepID=UPI0024B37ADC|nr:MULTISPECIES: hypothetical protein [Silvimonas]MDR3430150.1 hypothetical protein [Silvimonas sp.]
MKTARKQHWATLLVALVMTGSMTAAFADHDHGDDHWHDDHHDQRHDDRDWHHDNGHGHGYGHGHWDHDDSRWHERWRWDGWQQAHYHHFSDWRPGYVYQPGQWVWYQGHAYEARVPVTATVNVVPIRSPNAWLDISASIPLN